MKKKRRGLVFWRAKDGWRWAVYARNGRLVAESGEGYRKRKDAEHGVGVAYTVMIQWAIKALWPKP